LTSIPQGSRANKPEAVVVVPVVRPVVVTIRRLRIPSVIVPTAAAYHTVIAVSI